MQTTINLPEKPKIIKEEGNLASFEIKSCFPGYGMTLGNAFRRILLSSLPGAAITSVKISGAEHEFSTLPGVFEDVVEIILNLKQIKVKLLTDGPTTLYMKVRGKKEYFVEDIEKNPDVVIINPKQKILTVTETKVNLTMEMTVEAGRGYIPSEMLKHTEVPIGTIFLDATFSPVLSVNFDVKNTRVGTKTDYDHLSLEINTDGTITSVEAVVEAASLLKHHLSFITNLGVEPQFTSKEQLNAEHRRIREVLKRSIDELEISVRASNCLKHEDIKTHHL